MFEAGDFEYGSHKLMHMIDVSVLAHEFNRMTSQRCLTNSARKPKDNQYTSWRLPSNHTVMPISVFSPAGNFFINHENFFNNTIKEQKNNIANHVDKLLLSISLLDDNWDGNGSVALDARVILNAKAFISILPISIVNELRSNKIVPTPYGTLVFDWEKKSNLISVEIGEEEIGFFTDFTDAKNNMSSNGSMFTNNQLPSELVSIFKKLYSERD